MIKEKEVEIALLVKDVKKAHQEAGQVEAEAAVANKRDKDSLNFTIRNIVLQIDTANKKTQRETSNLIEMSNHIDQLGLKNKR